MLELAAHIFRTRIAAPFRWRRWRSFREPFVHTGAKGLRFKLHPPELIDGYIYAEGLYERRLLAWLRRRLRGRVMLDVGANVGNHSLYLHDRFAKVHAFEPNPVLHNRLCENILLNRSANVQAHSVGLGDMDATLPFRSNTTGNLGGGSFVREQFPVSGHLPVVAGDEYLIRHGITDVDFIKLDVEGFEPQVLRGLRKTLERDRPAIIFEFDGSGGLVEFGELRDLLPGYTFAEVARGRLVPFDQPQLRYYGAILASPART